MQGKYMVIQLLLLQQFSQTPVKYQVDNNSRNNLTDRQLVNMVLSGDTNAFGIIIKKTEKLVAQIIFKMIINPEDRKDLAQDIYLKVYKKLGTFQFQSKLSTWIAQAGYNTCIDHLRKKKLLFPDDINNEGTAGQSPLDNLSQAFSPENNDSYAGINQKELSKILQEETEKLSPLYKTLIGLYHQEELSYEEIGQITGLPGGTVKSYLFRARRKLKETLLVTYKKEDLC